MRILRDPLEAISAEDVLQLCTDAVSEGTEIEFKSDLPVRKGRDQDSWHVGGSIGEYARNEIAEEIIAFANTLGGLVCLGIVESDDHPKRAKSVDPLPRAHELARRLRQAVYDIVDPPLPVLEAIGIKFEENGSGVVLLRVPPSRRRPHRHQINKEVFIRREDESVRVTMREIHELTIRAVEDAAKIDEEISKRRREYRRAWHDWLVKQQGRTEVWGCGLHFLAIPTTPIDLGRVVGRPQLTNFRSKVTAHFPDGDLDCSFPMAPTSAWRPSLRSISCEQGREGRRGRYVLQTNGVCEFAYDLAATTEHPGLFVVWLIAAYGRVLSWIEAIRRESGVSTEFALAIQIPVLAKPVALAQYGAHNFEEGFGTELPEGFHTFPIASVGPVDEFPSHLQRFDEDIWNLAGHEIRGPQTTFSIVIS